MHHVIGGVLIATALLWGAADAGATAIGHGKMKIDFTDEVHERLIEKTAARVDAWGRAHYDAEHFRLYLPTKHGGGQDGNAKHAVVAYDGGMRLAMDGWTVEVGDVVVDRHAKTIKSSIKAWQDDDARPKAYKDVPLFHLTKNPNGAHAFAMAWTPTAAGYLNHVLNDEDWPGGQLAATGDIDGVDVAAVPVPAALPLLATALGGLGFALHRRRRAAA